MEEGIMKDRKKKKDASAPDPLFPPTTYIEKEIMSFYTRNHHEGQP